MAEGTAGERGVGEDVGHVDERLEILPPHGVEVGEEDVADAHQEEAGEESRPYLPDLPAPEPGRDAEEDHDRDEDPEVQDGVGHVEEHLEGSRGRRNDGPQKRIADERRRGGHDDGGADPRPHRADGIARLAVGADRPQQRGEEEGIRQDEEGVGEGGERAGQPEQDLVDDEHGLPGGEGEEPGRHHAPRAAHGVVGLEPGRAVAYVGDQHVPRPA